MTDRLYPIHMQNGGVCFVDAEDAESVRHFRWRRRDAKGYHYAERYAAGRGAVFMHRELTGALDGQVVDHIDGDGLNNSRQNLRVCSHEQNMQNRRIACHNKLGVKNVYQEIGRSSYVVEVKGSGGRKRKRVRTLEEAVLVAEQFRQEMHGEFANDGSTRSDRCDVRCAHAAIVFPILDNHR